MEAVDSGLVFCFEVEIALKLNGMPYAYQEENIQNKSKSLLPYNLNPQEDPHPRAQWEEAQSRIACHA